MERFKRGRDPEGAETIVFIRINSCRPRVEMEESRVWLDLKNAPALGAINWLVASVV